jgi:hypothetical protein
MLEGRLDQGGQGIMTKLNKIPSQVNETLCEIVYGNESYADLRPNTGSNNGLSTGQTLSAIT